VGKPISSALAAARLVTNDDEAWYLLLEVPRTAGGGGGFFRLTTNARHVVADGKTFQSAGMRVTLPTEQGDGSQTRGTFAVSNVSRVPGQYIERGELIGQDVTIWVMHESMAGTLDNAASWTQTIVGATVNEKEVTLATGMPAATLPVPARRFTRQRFRTFLPGGRR